jgi:hypothetical protein
VTCPGPKFVGWHRASPDHAWKDIVSGQTEAETWDQLLDQAPKGGDKLVLREGHDPNRDKLPLQRRFAQRRAKR